jgi:hypothetical protein
MKKNKGNGWVMGDQHPEPNLQCETVISDKTLVYYSEVLKHNVKEINNTMFLIYIYIQGVPGGMCQTSGGCSLF